MKPLDDLFKKINDHEAQQDLRKMKEKKEIQYDQKLNGQNVNQEQLNDMNVNSLFERCLEIFPYDPYESQKQSMKKIIESLINNQNLLFQSPTGTGKTLITICSALVYIEKRPNMQIMLLTRTNEQINGFVKEIRKIKNYPDINRFAVLAGRGQLCLKSEYIAQQYELKQKNQINNEKGENFGKYLASFCNRSLSNNIEQKKEKIDDTARAQEKKLIETITNSGQIISVKGQNKEFKVKEINQNTSIQNTSQNMMNNRSCIHHCRYKQIKNQIASKDFQYPLIIREDQNDQQARLPDIEDMKYLFEEQQLGCPFFFNKYAVKSSKIIFTSYNYLFKENILKSIQKLIQDKNLIVIIDEAHNITEEAEKKNKVKFQKKHFEQLDNTLQNFLKEYENHKVQFDKLFLEDNINNEIEQIESQLMTNADSGQSAQKNNLINSNSLNQVNQSQRKENKSGKDWKYKFNKHLVIQYDLFNLTLNFFKKKQDNLIPSDAFQKIMSQLKETKALDPSLHSYHIHLGLSDFFVKERKEELKQDIKWINSKQLRISLFEGFDNFKKVFNDQQTKQCSSIFSLPGIKTFFEDYNILDTIELDQFLNFLVKIYSTLSRFKNILKKYPLNEYFQKVKDQINLKYLKKIWHFFFKLKKFRQRHNCESESEKLQDHYFGIQQTKIDGTKQFYFEIGRLSSKYLFSKIKQALKIHSFILASGTLQPFELIQKSIGLEFEQHSADHIINPKINLFTQFITQFNGTNIKIVKNQNESQQILEVVNKLCIQAIEQILQVFQQDFIKKQNQKQGTIIFFKNYELMKEIYYKIKDQFKDFFVYFEDKSQEKFNKFFAEYKRNITDNLQNCIFLAVNRGKLSEGIDLKDHLCRVVIMYGVPFPYLGDNYIKCKKEYANVFLKEPYWYDKQTSNVINQSAGRCIRYKDDWGCIFFLDSTFRQNQTIYQHISPWIKQGEKHEIEQYEEDQEEWIYKYKQFLIEKANRKLQP